MTELEKAELTVTNLENIRTHLLQEQAELADERGRVALDAHTGDKKARSRLDEINIASAKFASEFASIEAAITEANKRLDIEHHDARLAADRAKAEQIAALKTAFVENGINAGDALSDFMRQQRDDMEALGIKAPTSRQFQVMSLIAIKTMLQALPTPWVNELQDWRLLLHPARRSFKDITADWELMIDRQIAERLGENKERAA